MAELQNDWITNGLIDFEYKKYVLMAYLKKIRESFIELKLYPFLSDLLFHYNNIKLIQQNKSLMYNHFPKELTGADLNKLRLTYQKIIEDDEVMKEIEQILEFAAPKIKEAVDEGKEIFDYAEDNLEISPIGLMPIYINEGYIFIETKRKKPVNVYRYQVSVFENSKEKYKGVNFTFIENKAKSSFETYENVKMELVRKYKELPNPATYLVECKSEMPYHSTVMPVAKRMFMRHISSS
ncbi:MAG: hypothetical protein AAF363_19450 [Bacteroidota bacterium]